MLLLFSFYKPLFTHKEHKYTFQIGLLDITEIKLTRLMLLISL